MVEIVPSARAIFVPGNDTPHGRLRLVVTHKSLFRASNPNGLWSDSSSLAQHVVENRDVGNDKLVVTQKFANDPIRLARMVKKVGQLAKNSKQPRPHPARPDGESGCPASAGSRSSQATSFTIRLAGWGPKDVGNDKA